MGVLLISKMCIRDRCGLEYYDDFIKYIENEQSAKALEELYSYTSGSYTHLDVYKRQLL